jgi:hypothetical protein
VHEQPLLRAFSHRTIPLSKASTIVFSHASITCVTHHHVCNAQFHLVVGIIAWEVPCSSVQQPKTRHACDEKRTTLLMITERSAVKAHSPIG